VATGTVTGSGVSGVICHAEARLYLSTATTPPNLFLLDLYSSSLPNDSAFQSPPGASNAFFTGYFSVGAAPGTYGSATGEPCGGLVFSYDLPVPPSVDCDGGVPGSCPTGCTSACSGFGCSPCVPVAPQVGYETYGSTDCLGNTQTTQGSWTATLTSVVPNGGSAPDAMATDYTIHGTFTANMTQGDSGADTAALTFSF
jgi:hypothetical protein